VPDCCELRISAVDDVSSWRAKSPEQTTGSVNQVQRRFGTWFRFRARVAGCVRPRPVV